MINSGVPEHVVQKLLGHKSAEMTARYAHLHDTTLREAFDRYCEQRVNIAGELLDYDPDSPPRTRSGSNTTWPGSTTPCPTATAAGRRNRTVPTRTPA
jgi:Phage integrase family